MAAQSTAQKFFEIKLSLDKTQAFVTLFPPNAQGDEADIEHILERLRLMRVEFGIRREAILDGIRQAREAALPFQVVGAQGTLPQHGQDAKIRYVLPEKTLSEPLPKHPDFPELIDWFRVDSARWVEKGSELAGVLPAQPGAHGKTCTAPVQEIPYFPGKPVSQSLGANVHLSENGCHLYASSEGYAYLQGERLSVQPIVAIQDPLAHGVCELPQKGLFFAPIENAQIVARDFVGFRAPIRNCYLRAYGDVLLHSAENSIIVTSGVVYVSESIRNCEIKTRQKIKMAPRASVVGGSLRAKQAIYLGNAGSDDFVETFLETGADYYTPVREIEIEQELTTCGQNILRINQALKPFHHNATYARSEERRNLVQKLHEQIRALELRVRDLREERRQNVALGRDRASGVVTVAGRAHPGVWVRCGRALILVENPLDGVRFAEAKRGASVQVEPLVRAA